jgi:tetrahydrodipicolinate N-succinyltransferase
VDGDAQICDLVVVGEGAHVGGRSVVCGDDIIRGGLKLEPRRAAVSATAAMRVGRRVL